MSVEFIGLCDFCGIEKGESWESERSCFNSPGEWSNRCNDCGGEEIIALEDILGCKKEQEFEKVYELYQYLKDSEDYKDRAKAKGIVEFLEVLI
jgi:hypothetical protein